MRPFALQELEGRVLLSAASAPLPMPLKTGEVFVVDDFDNKITQTDLGFNYNGGNAGAISRGTPESGNPPLITSTSIVSESNGSTGGSLRVAFDFTGYRTDLAEKPFGGFFESLMGLTETDCTFDGTTVQNVQFPGYALDFNNIYGAMTSKAGRTIDSVSFDVRLEAGKTGFSLKVELKDEAGHDVYARYDVSSETWTTVTLPRSSFSRSTTSAANFLWGQVSMLSFIVEYAHGGDQIINPMASAMRIDNVRLNDVDGSYPDLGAIAAANGSLLPQYTNAFLDEVRASSVQYFLDFGSTDPRTGGMVQDRSTFADLMTTGGTGFQLTAYVVGAERGYLTRAASASRTLNLLTVINASVQGPQAKGAAGYQGFLYHFLGIDGKRKLSFNFTETPGVDESLNTVELSTIDTALLIAGVVTARQYFSADNTVENAIRALADQIYGRVNWPFMFDSASQQFFLGWKPNETRDGPHFDIPDALGLGSYSGVIGDPATLDYYTDEGLLIALLAIGSPNPAYRMDPSVFYRMTRDRMGGNFVRTYPGSLFTYQFASTWLDTQQLGPDDPTPYVATTTPINYFDNTQRAIQANMSYTATNPNNRTTWQSGGGTKYWPLSAVEGPFDAYFAEAAPTAAIGTVGEAFPSAPQVEVKGESMTGDGDYPSRPHAYDLRAFHLGQGATGTTTFTIDGTASYKLALRYSNYSGGPSETVTVRIDGQVVASFPSADILNTGDWDNYFITPERPAFIVNPGTHTISVTVSDGDQYGFEVDHITLTPQKVSRALEAGTVAPYGAASSIVHAPDAAISSLWYSSVLRTNGGSFNGLLHPRFGMADAFNLNVADAIVAGSVHPAESRIIRASGAWANFTGFAIDQGPMLAMIDNYLSGQFVPKLFMSYPSVRSALNSLFGPAILGSEFVYQQRPNEVRVRFSESVAASLSTSDLTLTNLTTGAVISDSQLSLVYDGTSHTGIFGYIGAAALPNGNYRATIGAASVVDATGHPLTSALTLDFFVLAADATRDGTVDFDDLLILAQNYNGSGRTWATGDFSGDGLVDFDDLLLLAQNYNTTVAAVAVADARVETVPMLVETEAVVVAGASAGSGAAGAVIEEAGAAKKVESAAEMAAAADGDAGAGLMPVAQTDAAVNEAVRAAGAFSETRVRLGRAHRRGTAGVVWKPLAAAGAGEAATVVEPVEQGKASPRSQAPVDPWRALWPASWRCDGEPLVGAWADGCVLGERRAASWE